MAIYQSPGIYFTEQDQSIITESTGPLRPAFIGTAQKGPLNQPILITSAQQAIEVFGAPVTNSYLMHSVLGYLEEGDQCYVMRTGVESAPGQTPEIAAIAIDVSGNKVNGWGRLPLFSGIDHGKINLKPPSYSFHPSSIYGLTYNDAALSGTHGPTSASIAVTGTYTGSIDDSYTMIITSPPTTSSGSRINGAKYRVVRNSDGFAVSTGNLEDPEFDNVSQVISIGDGLSIQVSVSLGVLALNDTFTWKVEPDNRSFAVSVNGGAATTYQMPTATYATTSAFLTAFNAIITGSSYIGVAAKVNGVEVPQLRTTTAGDWLQITNTSGWALEVGTSKWAYDIPRAHLIGVESGTYSISTINDRVRIKVQDADPKDVSFSLPIGLNQPLSNLVSSVQLAGTVAGETLWSAFALTVPGGTSHLVIMTSANRQYSTLSLEATFSNMRTLRFSETVGIKNYVKSYRGYEDTRLSMPAAGVDPTIPASCSNPLSADCISDTAYFNSIVGFFVAPTAGSWANKLNVTVEGFRNVFNRPNRYTVIVKDNQNVILERVDDISFDRNDERYIGNVVNQGSKFGGLNGNPYINWEDRPSYLSPTTVRQPSQFSNKPLLGGLDGVPSSPELSSLLDAAVIGNPNTNSGLYAFQNPETYDISLLSVPGFTSGAVISAMLQTCEARGDVMALIDPPFGLRAQQVVDWHNGMLVSDMAKSLNSSYGALYWSWIKIYDQFNNRNVFVPPSGHVAAVYSRTAREREQWYAPAGLSRGRILTALDVENSPSKGERDLMYGSNNAVNGIVKFPQDGIVIYMQRTLQRADTALDRVNVRMLNSHIKKSLSKTMRQFQFEPNDRQLWGQVIATLDPYMADIKARRGVTMYKIICDESINTPLRIDRGELWVAILYSPTKSVETIVVNLGLLRTGASISTEALFNVAGVSALASATT